MQEGRRTNENTLGGNVYQYPQVRVSRRREDNFFPSLCSCQDQECRRSLDRLVGLQFTRRIVEAQPAIQWGGRIVNERLYQAIRLVYLETHRAENECLFACRVAGTPVGREVSALAGSVRILEVPKPR